MDAGNKALKKGGLSSFFTSKEDKYEKAVEFYVKAGNAYKLAKAWTEAGEAFYAAAGCYRQLGSIGDSGSKLNEAGECFKREDAQKCVEVWREAVEVYVDAGKWNRSGDMMKNIAEMYEKPDAADLMCEDREAEAIDCYQMAADYYKNESPPRAAAANKMLDKVATLAAAKGELVRAAGIFDEIAREYLDNKLLKFNAKGLMMRSLMCHLANGDVVSVEQNMAEYEGLDHTMGGSLESKFLEQILAAMKDGDKEAFGVAAQEYNQIKKLDPWMTKLLLKAKRSIPEEEEEEEEEEAEPEPQTADDDEDLT